MLMAKKTAILKKAAMLPTVLLTVLVVLTGLFAGCVPPADRGTLELNFVENTGSRMLSPELDLGVVSYRVRGVGPFGNSFEKITSVTPFEIAYLEHGEWSITVDAYNTEGVRVATGNSNVLVSAGETISLHIQLRPPQGTGSLLLDVYWNDAVISDPVIEAQLISAGGLSTSLNPGLVEPAHAQIEEPSLATGYYTCMIQLYEEATVVAGAVEAVCIFDSEQTTGEFQFDEVNVPAGGVDLEIDTDLQEPLTISLSGTVESFVVGQTMTVLAEADTTEDVNFTWYLNGVPGGTGASYTSASGLAPGFYRLDVIGFTTDGLQAGSTSHSFTVTEE